MDITTRGIGLLTVFFDGFHKGKAMHATLDNTSANSLLLRLTAQAGQKLPGNFSHLSPAEQEIQLSKISFPTPSATDSDLTALVSERFLTLQETSFTMTRSGFEQGRAIGNA